MPELIDKDYFKNMLLAWKKELSDNPNAESDIQIDMIRQFYNSVKDFQTIEAEQVKHGRWIPTEYDGYADGYPVYDAFECSECGHEHNGEEDTLTAFCPDCGAKMDFRTPTEADSVMMGGTDNGD